MRALVVLLVVAAPFAARADDSVGVIVTAADHKLQPQVTSYVEKWLVRHGHPIAKRAVNDDARTTVVNCMTIDDPACARGVVEARVTANAVVFASVVADPKTGAMTLSTYWFVKGHDPVGEHDTCEKCTGDAWHAVADRALTNLHMSADDLTHTVHREPPQPEPPPPIDHPGAQSRVLPYTMFGVGLAGFAASGWFFYWGAKAGPNEPYVYPDATGWAIGSAAIGAGAIIGGIVLWRSAQSAPLASLGPHGGYVGWITRF